jgi:hypothetical protein
MLSQEERQKRIDQIENENKALKELNDLSRLKDRVSKEPSIADQVGLIEERPAEQPLKKIANPSVDSSV